LRPNFFAEVEGDRGIGTAPCIAAKSPGRLGGGRGAAGRTPAGLAKPTTTPRAACEIERGHDGLGHLGVTSAPLFR
jgi:hypothetical protein